VKSGRYVKVSITDSGIGMRQLSEKIRAVLNGR